MCRQAISNKVKILTIFNQYIYRGGEAEAVDAISESLSNIADVARCDFLSADWTGPNAPHPVQQAIWMVRNPRSIEKLRRRQSQFGADVWLVHNVFPVGSAAVYREAHSFNVPIIQYIHNYRPFSVNGYLTAADRLALGGLSLNYWQEIRNGAWQNSILKTAWFAGVLWLTHFQGYWRKVKAWIAISEFVRQTFISAGIPEKDVFTLPHYFRPDPEIQHPENGEHYLFLGRLVDAKGINVLLDAWEILQRNLGPATPRLVIGGEGPLREAVVARANRNPNVNYRGFLSGPEKEAALKAARAVLVPSIWWEAAGLVVYEAYNVSRPVLAARSGALPENVIDSLTGRLHTPGDAEEIALQVLDLEENPEKRKSMGRQGRLWLEQNTSEADWQKRFLAIANYAVSRRS